MRASSLVEHCATTLIVAVLLAAAAVAQAKNGCHSGDKAALLTIKSAFGNASYFNSWTPDTPCCEWARVSCSGDGSARRVVGVSLVDDVSLAGPLPGAAIARLTALQQLVLNNVTGVNGTIPRDLTRLNATLSFLDIISTGISGPVPSFLSEITALGYLSLSSNKLTGTIPASLADMPNLYFLDLGYNRLTGTIPALLLGKASGDAYLYLSHNRLTGGVPAEFAAVNFWTVDLSYNGFKGDASFLLGANKPLLNLDLSHNAFSFNLSAVQLPEGLNSLELSHNDIYGHIPEMVVDMMLNYLNVSYNHLSGVVPAGGNMAWFDQSCFQHNKGLCGSPLPPCKQ